MVTLDTEIAVVGADGTELLRTVLPPGQYVIGRTAECDIQVNADLVSRTHARLVITDDGAHIEDLGSSNGTFVNDEQVTDPAWLGSDPQIRVGSATMTIRKVMPTSASVSWSPVADANSVRRLLPEELLGNRKYNVGREVAKGGMGSIRSAEEVAVRREVAMKLMRRQPSELDLLRFVEEAQITGQLEHPNIVPVHELGVNENGQPFYTMKMVQGITLRKVLELLSKGVGATVEKYPVPILLTIFQKVCDGVAFAHAKSVIHRDLKPENIMLGGYGEVLLMDWGLAKVFNRPSQGQSSSLAAVNSVVCSARFDEPIDVTMAGSIMGTPQYMSPEQARGESETLDQRSDIYSLGAILYQMLALRPSVTGKTAIEIVEKVVRGEIDSLTAKASRPIPDGLAAVVRKAMALDPAQRYTSVHDLQTDIAAFQGGFATSAEHATTWKQLRLLVARNKKVAVTAVAALGLVLLVSAGFTARVVAARNHAEEQKKRAVAGEKRVEETLVKANQTLLRLKFEKARAAFDEGRGDEGLAWLAAVLKQDPQNRVATNWLMSALSDRNFPVPSAPRIIIPKVNTNTYEGMAALRFSPDGSLLLAATRVGGLSLWDPLTGQPMKTFKTTADFRQAWWLPDGKQVVTAQNGAREAFIWDAEKGGETMGRTQSQEGQITWLVPSADGRYLVTADDKYKVQMWNAETLSRIGKPIVLPNDVQGLDISPDNRWLSIRLGTINETRIYDVATGEPVGTAVAETNGWSRFHPSAPRYFIPKVAQQNRWQIRDIATGRITESKETHTGGGTEGVFSPDGMYLATGSDDLRARIWDARTGVPVTPWLRHSGRVMRPEFSPEGLRLLTFGTDYTCRLWNVLNGELIAEPWRLPEGQYDPSQLRFSPDGAHVAVPTRARTIQVYDVREGRQLPLMIKDSGGIGGLLLSPDGTRCAVAFNSAMGRVRFFDTTTGEKLETEFTHTKGIGTLIQTADGRLMATASSDLTAQVWDVQSGQPVGKPLTHETSMTALALSADGRFLATASTGKDTWVRIWDVATSQLVGEPIKPLANVSRMMFSPDGKLIAVASDQGAAIYDLSTGQKIHEISRGQNTKDLRFNRDGSVLAIGTERDGLIAINPTTGKEVFGPLPHGNTVIAVRFSADGTRLLTGSLDGVARIWNAQTGEPATPPLRHGEVLTTAEFSPTGMSVATASRDGTVRIWDAATGDPLSEPLRHGAEVRTIGFTPDGRKLVAALSGDWVHIWDLPPEKINTPAWLPTLAEAVAGRRVSSQGEMTGITVDEFWRVREFINSRRDSEDAIERWAVWFVSDRATRAASPWGTLTTPAAIERIRTHDTIANLERLVRYQPGDPTFIGRYSKNLSYQAKTNPLAARDSEYLQSAGSRVFLERLLAAQRAAGTPGYGTGGRGFPLRDTSATPRELDLTWQYNMILDSHWVSDDGALKFDKLPKGLVTLDNVRWDIRGVLYAASLKQPSSKPMTTRVEGVSVMQKAKKIHALQTCAWPSPAGTKIANYVLHYTDGETRELPIVYGEDLREWGDGGATTQAKLAWTAPPGARPMRLFHRAYDNPRPDAEIASIDLVWAGADSAPVVVALTVE
jgi:WD40 repeat protein/serine/threonine protein kinase